MTRRSGGNFVRNSLVIFAVVSALCVCGPALYSRFNQSLHFTDSSSLSSSCAPCSCDCPPPLSLLQIAPGLVNLSVTDCGGNDPELKKEMEMQFVDLLTEELKLQESVSQEYARHMNGTALEAKERPWSTKRKLKNVIPLLKYVKVQENDRRLCLARRERLLLYGSEEPGKWAGEGNKCH